MDNATLATKCTGVDMQIDGKVSPPSRLFYGMVAPFTNMTLKGWLWYQGMSSM
jgi:hypothetical protein